jgi:diacylglycerol kinase family enzyme
LLDFLVPMSRCILLINQAAGASQRGHDPALIAAEVEKDFRDAGHEITTLLIAPGELDSTLGIAVASRPDVLIIGGGDGSVSAAAGVLAGTGIALGILPMGTFNLAARDLGVPLDFTEAARFLSNATSFPIDVMDVNDRTCLCCTIFGFYPQFSSIFENRDATRGQWWRKTIGIIGRIGAAFRKARALRLGWDSPVWLRQCPHQVHGLRAGPLPQCRRGDSITHGIHLGKTNSLHRSIPPCVQPPFAA